MKSVAQVGIHSSQFPENIQRDLFASLRTRRVNHKFHYDSVKQTQKWLALHEAHSPARYDPAVLSTYEQAFAETATRIPSRQVHLIGLGCGGGQKDVQLMKQLQSRGKQITYTPSDVSTAMTLVARNAALSLVPAERCFPLVCDLETAADLPAVFARGTDPKNSRLVSFFGMIPNFEPGRILPKLTALLRADDFLLFSANLAPGDNYATGMKTVLPQYDNAQTRDWLSSFLFDLGVEPPDGQLRFTVETSGGGLRRVVARFHFRRGRKIEVNGRAFIFARGESIRLFFSYRYTPEGAVKWLQRHGLRVDGRWVASSGEEGVFLCRKS